MHGPPRAIDPVLVSLLQGLAPGQSPIIRIGGDSTDDTWWPIRGMIPQGGIYYRLTKGWLRTTQALAALISGSSTAPTDPLITSLSAPSVDTTQAPPVSDADASSFV